MNFILPSNLSLSGVVGAAVVGVVVVIADRLKKTLFTNYCKNLGSIYLNDTYFLLLKSLKTKFYRKSLLNGNV
jgi:cystathionine beta-lyase/cystathionine gamma-synthase